MQTVIRRPRRLGALDGLRALAVGAVVIYHLNDRLLPGGFLGVDVFFVLSGYLVTSLLVSEHERSGSIGLRAFWGRRARRLWAAAWVVLTLVALAGLTGVWGADRQAQLPGDLFAAFAHIENYWMLAHGGYLQQFVAPSPVRHFWSLAVEEQFYFVWPLVMTLGVALVVRRGRKAMWALLGTLAVGSLACGLLVSPERAYLGLGTRAIELIVGAALAWWWSATPLAAPRHQGLRRAVAVWAAIGAVVLVAGTFVLHPYDEVLARGGFLTIGLAAAGVTGLAVIGGRVAMGLGVAPLVWVGRRSYGIYLLHWPLIVAMGPGRSTWLVAAVVVPVSVAGAAVLHRLVETPLILRQWRPSRMAYGSAALAVLTVVALVASRPSTTPTRDVASGLRHLDDPVSAIRSTRPDRTQGTTTTTTICVPVSAAPTLGGTPSTSGPFDPNTVNNLTDPTATECSDQIDVMVLGDSTGRGFSNGLASLQDPGLRIWDRTVLGCSLGGEQCPDWKSTWAAAVQQVHPDVVVLYFNPVSDLKGVQDAGFTTDEGRRQREQALGEAADIAGSTGAAVVMVTPPVPRPPEGLFFCDGHRSDTVCDPKWVSLWSESVTRVAQAHGAPVLDVKGWVDRLPDDAAARPDGMHFSGSNLVDVARWARPTLSLAVVAHRRDTAHHVKGGAG